MGSLTNCMLLSTSTIPSYFFNGLQRRTSSFRDFRHPASVKHFSRSARPIGVRKVITEAKQDMLKDSEAVQPNTCNQVVEQDARIETLIREIKDMFLRLGDGEISPSAYDTAWIARIPSLNDPNKPQFPTTLQWILKNQLNDGSWGEPSFFSLYDRLVSPVVYPIDIFEHNWMIDTIQRLGIDHHFRKEISNALDFLYRNLRKDGLAWERDAIVTDIDDTCMGLRLLRLHGYPISPDVLEYFKDIDGTFLCYMGETHKGVSDFFSLYRFSQIAFLGEKILKQTKIFTEQHLIKSIKDNHVYDKWAIKKALNKEIEWALRNPWKMSLPMLEMQEYIKNYGDNDVWIEKTIFRMYNINNSKYLELAKLECNKLQAIHTREAKSILLWWNSCGFNNLVVTQLNPKEIHFSICAAIYEPEFSTSRIAYTKCNCIESILKDIFQSHESFEELKIFCQAINEWKPAMVQVLPSKLKRVFMVAYETMNEQAIGANNAQGKDVFPYLHDLRKQQVQQYLKIREFKDIKQFEIFEEYVDQVKRGLAVTIRLLPAVLLMGDVLPGNALKSLVHKSTILEQLASYIALLNLMTEERSAVYMYMKEHNCSEQDALSYIEEKIDDAFVEFTHEYLKPNKHISHSCRRLIFEHGRIIRFSLNKRINGQPVESMDKVYTPTL
ncbi:bifunctional levopimaradiene synthase, chloroplastic-like [Dendrobium catenatum]|uniref:bifunctional levopimaradiene synthase, chloroplastic-like n=1 Tax=Dendrobium catenatum TaxID=906689 RepID=UPI00109F8FBC|nr:bifunctional levopimaradiene synthase, chloroplastic-like [Dendrobium catenatum]